MSPILMNILAYIAIIALLGAIAVSAWAVSTTLGLFRKVKSMTSVIDAPRSRIIHFSGVCKSILSKSSDRLHAIGGAASNAAGSIRSARDGIRNAANSVGVADVRDAVTEGIDDVQRDVEVANLLRIILKTLRRAAATNRR
jgi:hypothetical protein